MPERRKWKRRLLINHPKRLAESDEFPVVASIQLAQSCEGEGGATGADAGADSMSAKRSSNTFAAATTTFDAAAGEFATVALVCTTSFSPPKSSKSPNAALSLVFSSPTARALLVANDVRRFFSPTRRISALPAAARVPSPSSTPPTRLQ